jgi:hypothetical protein
VRDTNRIPQTEATFTKTTRPNAHKRVRSSLPARTWRCCSQYHPPAPARKPARGAENWTRCTGKFGLVSQTVRDLTVGSGLACDDRGVHERKGVPGEWRVYTAGREWADRPS